jgi:hypothetical protein
MYMMEVTVDEVIADIIRKSIECPLVAKIFYLMRLPMYIGMSGDEVRHGILRSLWMAQIVNKKAWTSSIPCQMLVEVP